MSEDFHNKSDHQIQDEIQRLQGELERRSDQRVGTVLEYAQSKLSHRELHKLADVLEQYLTAETSDFAQQISDLNVNEEQLAAAPEIFG